MYVYKHFEFILADFATQSIHKFFYKIITSDSPKSDNPVKSVQFYTNFYQLCWQFLPIMLELCSTVLLSYYAQNYASIIGSSLLSLILFNTTLYTVLHLLYVLEYHLVGTIKFKILDVNGILHTNQRDLLYVVSAQYYKSIERKPASDRYGYPGKAISLVVVDNLRSINEINSWMDLIQSKGMQL